MMSGVIDVLRKEDIQTLVDERTAYALSLYMPTHRAGREIRQDPVRLKNLLNKALQLLEKEGMRAADARTMLEPAYALIDDDRFWRYQSDTLALFCSPNLFRYFRLPINTGELVIVSNRFHLKPLLYFFTHDTRFYVLQLSKKNAVLYQGSRETLAQIPAENLPHGLDALLQFEEHERQMQYRPLHIEGESGEGTPAPTHGYYDPGRHEKLLIEQYVRDIAKQLTKMLLEVRVPLVVAGVDYIVKMFMSEARYEHILALEGNPERLSLEALHQRSWQIVEPYIRQQIAKARDRYYELKANGKTANLIQDLLPAAIQGRIDTLFVGVGVQYWGTYEVRNGVVLLDVHKDYQPGDWDLTNDLAIYTLLHRGTVYAVEPANVPDNLPMAAILRY